MPFEASQRGDRKCLPYRAMIQNMWKQEEEIQEPKPLTPMAVAIGIAVATALHYFTSPSLILWHNLFQRLYYLPIIYAAIYFGWRGGLVASTVSAVCYIPHILHAWHHMPDCHTKKSR